VFRYTKSDLIKMSTKTGFIQNTLEKVLRLSEVLNFLFKSKYSDSLSLKGGTAINLVIFDLPRLSIY
jgi:predicted nucleotidyltransferase component of viral defense system